MKRPAYPALARERVPEALVLSGFGRPFGFARDGLGRVYVADMDLHAICRLQPDFEIAQWLGGMADEWSAPAAVERGAVPQAQVLPPGRFNGPHSVAVSDDARLYIVTYYTPGIHVLEEDGQPVAGSSNDMRLVGPATGVFDQAGRLLVTEYALHGVFAFDKQSRFLGALGGCRTGFRAEAGFAAGSRPGEFDRPHMCRANPQGDLIVVDTWNHRLQRFTTDGRFAGWIGNDTRGWSDAPAPARAGSGDGDLNAPVAISFAEDGRFVVTDWGNNRLQWFDAQGRFLEMQETLDLDRPYDAQILGDFLFVADSHHGRVLIVEKH